MQTRWREVMIGGNVFSDLSLVAYLEIFRGDQFQQGVCGGAVMRPYGFRAKPC